MFMRSLLLTGAFLAFFAAAPASAQDGASQQPAPATGADTPIASDTGDTDEAAAARAATASLVPNIVIQRMRAQDQRGLNVFEPPKDTDVPFTGFRIDLGAAFAQQFQAIDHSNAAAPSVVNGVDRNQLVELGPGSNLATANLYLNAQLAPGIRVALSTYLSSRRHPEVWVKDGYLLVDESPIKLAALERMMEYVTLRIGHFELNYGDAHFRRTDNGNALFNPFVGNYIMDAFTTEIGGEVYFRANGVMAMGAVTGGEMRGSVVRPDDRSPSYMGKLGFDRQVTPDLRLRLTGSTYTTSGSINNTLYGGDRAGSRYYYVLSNTEATDASSAGSGHINPGFRDKVTAYQLNPFIKYRGLELFGVLEQAEGRAQNEDVSRTWNQYAADVVYRFLPEERLFVGGRYNVARGEMLGVQDKVGADRFQLSAGWFLTPTLLLKGEYVTQRYNDFPESNILHKGKFNGFVVEGVVAF
jgi:hypothetical protein